jgi:hypothetical protein
LDVGNAGTSPPYGDLFAAAQRPRFGRAPENRASCVSVTSLDTAILRCHALSKFPLCTDVPKGDCRADLTHDAKDATASNERVEDLLRGLRAAPQAVDVTGETLRH